MAKWAVLMVLGAAQFLMVLDQAVMNVAISQLVEDFDTTVTTIQAVIALYALVMAALMMTGGKIGDIIGRRRAFTIGMVIYGCGSALTAASWSVPSLMLGWSILEGIGAALVLPALVALTAGTYKGEKRAIAYGVLGGIAGAGIAVGPILGGWATTELSWRVVFIGEVVVAIAILLAVRVIAEPERTGPRPSLDWVGSVVSALGLALVVLGVLQASNWGWLRPLNSPIEPFGFSLTPFVVAAGAVVLVRVPGLGASPGGGWPRTPDPLPALPKTDAARRPLDAVRPEPDPDGDLLHDPAVPAGRAGARRPRDRNPHAAGIGRAVRRPRSSGPALSNRDSRRARSSGSGSGSLLVATLLLLDTIDPTLDSAPSCSRWGCSASGWA